VLSGASSITLALAASGLNGQRFAFEGYLPQEPDARARRIRELETRSRRDSQTQLAIETPYRNTALAGALLAQLQPGTRLSIACGLTLPGGWCRTATVERWRDLGVALPPDVPAIFMWLAA
jgi:16S rRNA (cytidine1402-2'-O)-methyltransferase